MEERCYIYIKNSKRKCGLPCSSADFVLSRIYSSFHTKELWSKVLLEAEEDEQLLGLGFLCSDGSGTRKSGFHVLEAPWVG